MTMIDLSNSVTFEPTRALLADVFNAMDYGVALFDTELNFVLCNERYRDLVYPPDFPMPEPGDTALQIGLTVFGTGFYKLPPESDPKEMTAAMLSVIQSYGIEVELERTDGVTLEVASRKTALGGYLITAKDITDRKRAEQIEAQRIAAVNDAVGALDEGFALLDPQMRFVICNPQYMALAFPPDHPVIEPGTPARITLRQLYDAGDVVLPDDMDFETFADDVINWVRSFGAPREYSFRDGRTLGVKVSRTALDGYLLTLTDLTEARNAEQQARDMLYEAFQSLDEGMVLCDNQMRFVFGNDAWRRMMFDRPDRKPPNPGDSVIENLIAQLKTGYYAIPNHMSDDDYVAWMMGEMAEHGKQVPFQAADGRHFIGSSHSTSFGGSLLFVRDVTKQHQAEDKARSSFQEAIEALGQAVALFDHNLGFVFANKAYFQMWFPNGGTVHPGDNPGDIGLRLMRDYPGTLAVPEGTTAEDLTIQFTEITRAEIKNYEMPVGDGRTIIASSQRTELGGFLVTFVDETERRGAEERRLQAINEALDAVDYAMGLFDADKRFVIANKVWEETFGIGGRNPNPGDDGLEIYWRAIERGFFVPPEGLSKDDLFQAGLNSVDRYEKNFPQTLHDGRLLLGSSTRTALGGYLLSYRDITEQTRVEAELAASRDHAHQNEKLSALGELLAGVAHELNNPLSVVFGYSQMLRNKIDDPVIAERIELICQSAERAAKIVKTFLAMARQRPTKIEQCSINEAALTALEVSSYSLRANGTRVRVDFDEDLPDVSGDFDQLAQVFSNLIINAGHAVEGLKDQGEIVVRSFAESSAGMVAVEVRDNGHGIPQDIQKRIFEPFFTTKDVGEGTGVGLAFSHRIVSSHGGMLDLTSTPGHGTSFFVRLAATRNPSVADDEANARDGLSHVRTALVVDDEEGVAQLIADLLTDDGIMVTKTTSPREALNLITSTQFDVVLSDYKMPGMDGQTLFEAVRSLAPDTAARMGFITGDALSAPVRNFFETWQRPFIEKPIVKAELRSLVERSAGQTKARRMR